MSKLGESIKGSAFVKKMVYTVIGAMSFQGLAIINKMKVNGMDKLKKLPKTNVLFVSNHQTYFADVIALLHVFCAVKWGKRNKLGIPFYLLKPFTNVHYVGAATTLEKNWLTRFFSLAGAIPVKRTWNADSKEERKGLETADFKKIEKALASSWVITFPQGTTKPFAPGRKGTVHSIKRMKPIVVPIVIGGFNQAFDKKGLRFRKKGTLLTITVKPPMQIDYNAPAETILEEIMDAIEQSKSFMPKQMVLADNNTEIPQNV